MASHEEILKVINNFVQNYQAKNLRINLNWDCLVYFLPTDIQSATYLQISHDKVWGGDGIVENPNLTLIGQSDALVNLLEGDFLPLELYQNKKIRIIGSEEDLFSLNQLILNMFLG